MSRFNELFETAMTFGLSAFLSLTAIMSLGGL